MDKIVGVLLTSFLLSLLSIPSYSHPGRTASDGCHYCRTNCGKWGVPWNARHCHGGYKQDNPASDAHAHKLSVTQAQRHAELKQILQQHDDDKSLPTKQEPKS